MLSVSVIKSSSSHVDSSKVKWTLLKEKRLLVASENSPIDFVDMAQLYMLQSHSKAFEKLFGPLYLLSTLLVINGIVEPF